MNKKLIITLIGILIVYLLFVSISVFMMSNQVLKALKNQNSALLMPYTTERLIIYEDDYAIYFQNDMHNDNNSELTLIIKERLYSDFSLDGMEHLNCNRILLRFSAHVTMQGNTMPVYYYFYLRLDHFVFWRIDFIETDI